MTKLQGWIVIGLLGAVLGVQVALLFATYANNDIDARVSGEIDANVTNDVLPVEQWSHQHKPEK